MKCKHFLLSAFFCLTIFSGCREENFGFNAESIKYQSKFEEEFGKPDPNHTWGFVDIPIAENSEATRAAFPNSNQWGSLGLDVPAPLTQAQKDTVTHWFEHAYNPIGITVSWEDYFAQQVSSTPVGRSHMDYLLDAGNNSTDHVYNFNNGDCSETNVNNQYQDRIQYMTGQSTLHFGYHESVGQNTYFDHYVIIPGEVIDYDNTYGLHGMYFVGFDYEAYKSWAPEEDRVERDWYFNDWIIRIAPGTYTGKSQRVMCEDLGGSFDWDFNDVVFDAYVEGKGNKRFAHITVQCAGGTLPIIVGTQDEAYEAHSLFGVSTSTVVIRPQAPVQYTVQLHNGEGNYTNAKDIPIYVNGMNIAGDLTIGSAPQRFACPVGTEWQDELKCITLKYERFPAWARDQNTQNVWELHAENHPSSL